MVLYCAGSYMASCIHSLFQQFDKRIDLFVIMDSIPNCHSIIANALMDVVMEAINTIVSY